MASLDNAYTDSRFMLKAAKQRRWAQRDESNTLLWLAAKRDCTRSTFRSHVSTFRSVFATSSVNNMMKHATFHKCGRAEEAKYSAKQKTLLSRRFNLRKLKRLGYFQTQHTTFLLSAPLPHIHLSTAHLVACRQCELNLGYLIMLGPLLRNIRPPRGIRD